MRQFLAQKDLDKDGTLEILGKDARYLGQVLRLRVGDALEVRTPSGELVCMQVALQEKKRLVLARALQTSTDNACVETKNFSGSSFCGGVSARQVDSSLQDVRIWLLQCMPKATKLDQIIRQSTEIGVEKIFLVASERSLYEDKNANNASKMQRFLRIIKEARQQSASPVQTSVTAPNTLANVLATVDEELATTLNGPTCTSANADVVRLLLTEAPLERKGLHQYLYKKPKIVVIAVGSEGGVSPKETELFKQAGFLPMHFATNVLRTETAAIYGIATVQNLLTEFCLWQLKESK